MYKMETIDPISGVADAAKTMFELFLKAIPPEQIRLDRAKARSPLLAAIIEWRLKRKRMKQIDRLAKEIKQSGYDVDTFIRYVNDRPEMTPMDSLTSFLVKQRVEQLKKK